MLYFLLFLALALVGLLGLGGGVALDPRVVDRLGLGLSLGSPTLGLAGGSHGPCLGAGALGGFTRCLDRVVAAIRLLLAPAPQKRQLSTDKSQERRAENARRREVQEGRLCAALDSHGVDSRTQAGNVRHERGEKVVPRERRRASNVLLGVLEDVAAHVEAEAEGDEEAGDDDVAETQHREPARVLGSEKLDGRVNAGRNRHHDGGVEDPEDVVDEEQAQKEHRGRVAVETEEAERRCAEAQGERVREQVRAVQGNVERRQGNGWKNSEQRGAAERQVEDL